MPSYIPISPLFASPVGKFIMNRPIITGLGSAAVGGVVGGLTAGDNTSERIKRAIIGSIVGGAISAIPISYGIANKKYMTSNLEAFNDFLKNRIQADMPYIQAYLNGAPKPGLWKRWFHKKDPAVIAYKQRKMFENNIMPQYLSEIQALEQANMPGFGMYMNNPQAFFHEIIS